MLARRAVTSALALAVLAGCAGRPESRSNFRDTKNFASAPGKLVVLDVRSLDAEVEVVAEGAIEVAVEVAAHSSSRAAARRWVERNTPVYDDSPARLEIATPRRSSVSVVGFLETEGVVRVKVPAECRLEVRTASGDVSVRGEATLGAPLRIETSSGDAVVRGGVRELLVETASGDVRVTGSALALLEADTASGDVTLEAGADRVVLDTASGEVVLRNLRGDLSATSSSGDVEARWRRLPAGGRVTVETSSGEVTLRLAGGVAVTGEVRSSSGRIESELPGEEDRRGKRFTLSGGGAGAESGAAVLSVRTVSGDVRLLTAAAEI